MKVKETQLCDLLPRISIALVHSSKKARRYLGQYGVDAELGSRGARTVSFSNGFETKNLVIMHDRGGEPEQQYALLAHEAVHVAQRYFEDIGEEDPSEELRAYAVQAVTQHLVYEHRKWLKKSKKN